MIQCGERCYSLLTSLYSLLAFGRSGLFGPPLCGGSAPATPPLLQPRVVASMWAIRRCRPVSASASPRLLADSENVPARARQARPLPYLPNVHGDDHREPASEMLTVHSPRRRYTEHGLVVTSPKKKPRLPWQSKATAQRDEVYNDARGATLFRLVNSGQQKTLA